MSFLSSVFIGMIEKELASQTPEIEQFALQIVGTTAKDMVEYVEKKMGVSAAPAQDPAPAS